MKILAIAGLQSPDLDQIEQLLNNAGMAPAVIMHEDESINFAEWHDIFINNLDIEFRYAKGNTQYHNQLALKVEDVYSADNDATLWGWADPKSVWTLDLWLDNKPNFHALLPCFSPERWLASRLVADSENLQANEDLDQWLEVHRQLLRVHFRYPDRTMLVDGYRCLSSPQRFLDYLTEKWEMPLDGGGVAAMDLAEMDPLALLLAQQVTHANSEIWSLQQTIEASLEAFSPELEPDPREDPHLLDVAMQSYRDMTLALCRLGSVETLFTDGRQENELLLARLTELEYLHEATLLNERGLITELEKLNEVYQDQLGNGQELQKNVEVLKTELANQTAELVECNALINDLTVELEGCRRSEKDLQAEVESLGSIQSEYNDLSEKTKQVQVQYQNAQEENVLLLQQLHLVQVELETVFLKTQEAEKKITELLAERDHHAQLAAERQNQVVALTSQRDMEVKAKADAQARIAALEQAQQELTAARDTLAQEKVALTQARDAEAKAKAAALAQRDGEAQAKAEALAQRDTATKAKTDAQARVTKLEQVQQELTDARDALAQEKVALAQALDAEAKARVETLAQWDALSEKNKHLQAEYQDSHEENVLLLQQLHLVQEELETVFLKTQEAEKKITELMAERDHHAQLAAECQNQVVALTSQRDMEVKAKAEAQTRNVALEQAQQELTAARDALAQEKVALTQARDAEAKAKVAALAQRDAEAKARVTTQSQLEAQAQVTNDFHNQINSLTMERDTLQPRLGQMEQRLNTATITESELQKHIDKATSLEAELKDSQEENELLLQQLHLVQEELESLFLKSQDSGHAGAELTAERDHLAKLVTEKQHLVETLIKARDELNQLSKNRRAQIDARDKLIVELRERLTVLGADLKALQLDKKTLAKQIQKLQENPDQSNIEKLEELAKSRRVQINQRDEVIRELRGTCESLKKELHAQATLVMTLEEKLNNSTQNTASTDSELRNANVKA